MLKAMLRNPEGVLETNANILANLAIDLSPYAADISKPFGTQVWAWSLTP